MAGATEATRNAVWQEMLDTARLVRTTNGWRAGNTGSTWASLRPPTRYPRHRGVSGAIVAVLVAWDFLAGYANNDAARRTLAELARRVTRVTDCAGSAHVPIDERLNAICEEEA